MNPIPSTVEGAQLSLPAPARRSSLQAGSCRCFSSKARPVLMVVVMSCFHTGRNSAAGWTTADHLLWEVALRQAGTLGLKDAHLSLELLSCFYCLILLEKNCLNIMKALWESDWTHLNCALSTSDVNVPVCILKFNCVALPHLSYKLTFVLFRAFPGPRSRARVAPRSELVRRQGLTPSRAPWTRSLSQKSSHLGG